MTTPTAIDLIVNERLRQTAKEGYSTHHDDAHKLGELADAAACYVTQPHKRKMLQERVLLESARGLSDPDAKRMVTVTIPGGWPWGAGDWKPSPADRVRELVKAGALIVAEIERLRRCQPR